MTPGRPPPPAPPPAPALGLADALLAFLRSEAIGGLLLIAASAIALVWSNSPLAPAYVRLLKLHPGGIAALSVQGVINDGLMAFFFLLAGLEIRREMAQGHLAGARAIAAPGIAALGGMVMPALIYLAVTHGDAAARRGWAIPVATDIAFSLAVLRVLGDRVDVSLRVFLTALAILDDLGAIVVIAVFYSEGLARPYVAGALLVCAGLLVLRRARVVAILPYLAGGALLWALVFNSGVHATLAGVTLAFLVPEPVAERLERRLSDVVAYAILPLFGLANAGLDLHAVRLATLLSPAPLGVLLGLLLGKQAGVFGATMLGRRLGVLRLPAGMSVGQLYGAAVLCGIGFTMSLFIGHLAFRHTPNYDDVKLAVLLGSGLSALLGVLVLRK